MSRSTSSCVLGAAVLATACASRPAKPPEPLASPFPYHVLVAPVELPESLELGEPVDEDLWLEFRTQNVSTVLADWLDRSGFTRVSSTYRMPVDPAQPASTEEPALTPAQWLTRARELEADLLLVPKVEYGGDIARSPNEMFWLNLPLFLLGGPFCYMVNDQSFDARVTLEAQVYELSWDDETGSRAVTTLPLRADFNGTTLDFVDRAGGKTTSYATSLVIPAGFLSRESTEAVNKVREAALTVIVEELLDELAASSWQFERNAQLAWLEVPLAGVEAKRLPMTEVDECDGCSECLAAAPCTRCGSVTFRATVVPVFENTKLGCYQLSAGGKEWRKADAGEREGVWLVRANEELLREPSVLLAAGELWDSAASDTGVVQVELAKSGEAVLRATLTGVPHGLRRVESRYERESDKDPRPWFDGELRLRVTDGRGGARTYTFGVEPLPLQEDFAKRDYD